jgi:GntR family transcriptional regulator/MocR family aminotransferase
LTFRSANTLPNGNILLFKMAASVGSAVSRSRGSFIPPVLLDFGSETPLYRQISVWFQRSILAGQLQPGQRVPSTRALAKELRVSRIPVLGAYELLIAEGYFEPFVGTGTCVSRSIPNAYPAPEGAGLTDSGAGESLPAGRRMISGRASALRGPAQIWLRDCRECTDLEHFPIAIWSNLVSRHARKTSRDTMGYGDTMGYWPLREALAEYLGAFRAVNCDPSQILMTTGAQQALQISSLALLDHGDAVWIEEPGYPGTHQALKLAGAQLVSVPVDEHGLDVGYGVRSACEARAAYVTPALQYPNRVTMSATRRVELLRWAARNGSWIVEDDYDSEYRYSGNPRASLQGLSTDGRVIYIGTLSKVMFPTLRLGFAVIPADLVEAFLDIRNATDTVSTPMLHQLAMTDFIREGHFSRHIKRMRGVYMERRRAIVEAVRQQADGLLQVTGEDAGLYVLALLPAGVEEAAELEIVSRARRQGLPVGPLCRCYLGPPERSGLMLGYTNIKLQAIPAMISTLKSIIDASLR